MSFSKTLSRTEMKNIMAGGKSIDEGGCITHTGCTYNCCIDNGDGTCTCSTCCVA